jgi:hypothetical protein
LDLFFNAALSLEDILKLFVVDPIFHSPVHIKPVLLKKF